MTYFDPFANYEPWRKHALGEMLDLLYCLQQDEIETALQFLNRLQAAAAEMKQIYVMDEMVSWFGSGERHE